MRIGLTIIALIIGGLACGTLGDGGPKPIDTAGIQYPCRDSQTGLSRPCRAIWLEPDPGQPGSIALVGDTLPVRAFSDSNFTVAAWSVGAGLEKRSASSMLLWTKGSAVGSSSVTANVAGGQSATTTIEVVDSSAITSLTAPATSTETIRAGAAFIPVALRDASGREVAAIPQWSASNDALVTIRPQSFSPYGFFYPGAYVTLKGQGSVTLTVTFRNLSTQVKLFITP